MCTGVAARKDVGLALMRVFSRSLVNAEGESCDVDTRGSLDYESDAENSYTRPSKDLRSEGNAREFSDPLGLRE